MGRSERDVGGSDVDAGRGNGACQWRPSNPGLHMSRAAQAPSPPSFEMPKCYGSLGDAGHSTQAANLDGAAVLTEGKMDGQSRLKEAQVHFLAAARIDPEMPGVWANLADVTRRLGDIDGALEYANMAMSADPLDPVSYSTASRCYGVLGRVDAQLVMARRARELDPSSVTTALDLAAACLEGMKADRNLEDEALAAIDDALELAPNDPMATKMKLSVLVQSTQTRRFVEFALLVDPPLLDEWERQSGLKK